MVRKGEGEVREAASRSVRSRELGCSHAAEWSALAPERNCTEWSPLAVRRESCCKRRVRDLRMLKWYSCCGVLVTTTNGLMTWEPPFEAEWMLARAMEMALLSLRK